jgi:hypothetical protein
MIEKIGLADWIAALRVELTEAVRLQEAREAAVAVEGSRLAVAPLRLKELKLEVNVTSACESSATGEAKVGVKFYVVSGEVSSKGELSRHSESTHRVTLLLEPGKEIFMGEEGKNELFPRPHAR